MTGLTQVLAGFDVLPDELLVRTVDHLDRADLARVRLVSQRLNLISTEKLFERVTLYAHWAREDKCAEYVHDEEIEQDAVQLTSDDGEQSPEEVSPRGARDLPNEPNDGVFEKNVAPENEQDATDNEIAVDGRTPHMVEEARTVQPSDGFALERNRSNSVRSDFSGQTMEVGEYERNLTDRENSSNRVPQWATDGFPGPLGYDAQSLKNILQHKILRNYVREVQVYTCETHCDHHPSLSDAWFDGGWPRPTYHPVYIECIKRLNNLPNLRALTVHFDRHKGDDYQDDTLQDPHFQKTWLDRIIRSSNGRVTELAIRHYENPGLKEGMMLHYRPVLMQNTLEVTSLRLSIKHEETSPDSGPVYRVRVIS
ncbi:hypothetical protein N0V94_004547 [Neodidymelliopsis sp. IMI 364377]|nr:hypothetical protein N0V94_004547 [Neodidymelliopsis sp. IMI 364377]